MKMQIPKKHVTKRAIILLAILLVAVMISAWWSSVWHGRRMTEGFSELVRQDAAIAAQKGGNREGFFDTPVITPAALLQKRKTQAYMNTGFGQFFSANTASDITATTNGYMVSFQPTAADQACDVTTIPSPCLSPIDAISANDSTLAVPAPYSGVPYAIQAPSSSTDRNVYILGGTYQLSRTTLNVHAAVVAGTGGGASASLVMPRSDYATRLLMLMRPLYVRIATRAGLPQSSLYWINWGAAGTDGPSYDSYVGTPNAVLLLVQVTDMTIDPTPKSGPLSTIGTAVGSYAPPTSGAPPTASIASIVGGSAAASSAKPSTLPVPTSVTVPLVCYYPKYASPAPLAPGTPPPLAIASVYASLTSLTAGASATLQDGGGANVLRVTASGAPNLKLTVTSGSGAAAWTVPVPTGAPAVAIVSLSYDSGVAACVTPTQTSIRTFHLPAPIGYRAPASGTSTSTDIAAVLKPYGPTTIPNLADVALRVKCLSPAPASSSGIEGFFAATFTSPLPAGQSLAPGQSLASAGGGFVAVFQQDGDLVVFNVASQQPVWRSGTRSATTPGACTLGADGVLRITAAGTSQIASPLWASMPGIAPPDQAPFTLVLRDGPPGEGQPGQLQIVGKYSAGPVWSSV